MMDWFFVVVGLVRELVCIRSKNDYEVMREMLGEYMVGLWKSGVLEGLFWCRVGFERLFELIKEYVVLLWFWVLVMG